MDVFFIKIQQIRWGKVHRSTDRFMVDGLWRAEVKWIGDSQSTCGIVLLLHYL